MQTRHLVVRQAADRLAEQLWLQRRQGVVDLGGFEWRVGGGRRGDGRCGDAEAGANATVAVEVTSATRREVLRFVDVMWQSVPVKIIADIR